MKKLIVYYSLEGNTKYAAEMIAEKLQADVLELMPEKAYPTGTVTKFIFGGKSAKMAEIPALRPYQADLAAYDWIILGTPVWAATFAPPLRTFLKEQNLSGKKLAFFACSASGDAVKCLENLKREAGMTEKTPELSLRDPSKRRSEENEEKIKLFCEKIQNS